MAVTKSKAHAKKMEQRRLDNERKKMCRETLRLVLPSIYLILAEEYHFGNEELRHFNARLFHYTVLHQEKPERAAVYTEDVIEILIEKYGIDPEIVYGLLGETV